MVGWFIAICIVSGTLAGLWVDSKMGTKPILALVGVTIGTFFAMYGVYRMLRPGLPSKSDKGGSKD